MRACIALLLCLGGCSLDTVSQGAAIDSPSSPPQWSPAKLRFDPPLRARPGKASPRADGDEDAGSPRADEPTSDQRLHRGDAGGARDAKPVESSDSPASMAMDGGGADPSTAPNSADGSSVKDASTDSAGAVDAAEGEDEPSADRDKGEGEPSDERNEGDDEGRGRDLDEGDGEDEPSDDEGRGQRDRDKGEDEPSDERNEGDDEGRGRDLDEGDGEDEPSDDEGRGQHDRDRERQDGDGWDDSEHAGGEQARGRGQNKGRRGEEREERDDEDWDKG